MATTLTISIFRNNEVTIGHVGDCRVYLIQQGRIRRVTNDHSYAGVQLKLGLITVEEAANSQMRSVLTRSGRAGPDDPRRLSHASSSTAAIVIVQCTDGVWMLRHRRGNFRHRLQASPEEACKELVDLAERRGGDDNLSVQVVTRRSVERLSYYRGLPIYQKERTAIMGNELEVGQTLDDRYRLTDLISRSGMAIDLQGQRLKTTGRPSRSRFRSCSSNPIPASIALQARAGDRQSASIIPTSCD